MPEHHHGAAGTDLLPLWVQITWIIVLAVFTATHAVHLLTMRGQARGWHATHLLMGVGMLYMVTPWVGAPGSTRAWQYLFAATALGVAGWVAHELQAGRAVNFLWLPAGLGLAAMAYMFLLHRGSGVRELTYALVAYQLAEAAGWAHGWFAEQHGRRPAMLPYAVGGRDAVPLAGPARDVKAAQAAMALAMGYMFLAMDADAAAFLDKAFHAGAVTEQTIWAGSLLALVVLACIPSPGRQVSSATPGAASRERERQPPRKRLRPRQPGHNTRTQHPPVDRRVPDCTNDSSVPGQQPAGQVPPTTTPPAIYAAGPS